MEICATWAGLWCYIPNTWHIHILAWNSRMWVWRQFRLSVFGMVPNKTTRGAAGGGDSVIWSSISEITLHSILFKSTSNCLWALPFNGTCCNNVGCEKYTLKLTWVVCCNFQWRVFFILLRQIYLLRILQESNRQLFKQDKWKLCNENPVSQVHNNTHSSVHVTS